MTIPNHDNTADRIRLHAEQMRRARANRQQNPLMGLAIFGMVGWSVAIPTVVGIALGVWLDRAAPQPFSWTLTLLFAGVMLGALIAWRWVMREHDEAMGEQHDDL